MPKVKKERTKFHHSVPKKSNSDDELEDLGISFKVPPPAAPLDPKKLPRLIENPFTGEKIDNEDSMSMASSRMSSRSSASRLGRDGDGNVVTKKKRRQARRDFLLNRLNLSRENDEYEQKLKKKKETGGTAATIDSLLGSLPTQSQLFIENIQKETKEKLNNNAKLTQKDCRNSRTKRANRIIKEEITTFQKKIESTPKMSLMEQLKMMKNKIIDNVESQNALLEESEKVEKAAQEYF